MKAKSFTKLSIIAYAYSLKEVQVQVNKICTLNIFVNISHINF